MNQTDVQTWLDRYVDAWRGNEREPITALFTDDATYRFRPYGGADHSVEGIDAIVDAWLGDSADEPGTWDARYEAWAVDGDLAVATGMSHYLATADDAERTYHNVFLLRFAPDGRCAEFTEYYMLEEAT